MIEHGTVTGNVSRTHRPCGACGELVESCEHDARRSRPRSRLTLEQVAAAAAVRAQHRIRLANDVAGFRRLYGGDR